MKTSTMFAMLVVACCLLLIPHPVSAQYIYGHSVVNYNAATNIISASTSTELDFSVQEYYQAYANGQLTDKNGGVLSSITKADTDRDGYVDVNVEFAATYGMQYTMTGTHRGRMSIQDPAWGNNYYLDFYNFGWFMSPSQSEGQYVWLWYGYYGRGPSIRRPMRDLTMGRTVGTNIALAMPDGYLPGSAAWDSLTPDEKAFVLQHPFVAADFYSWAQDALHEAESRFPSSELHNGRGDAFRHALWSNIMASAYGAELAQQYGDAHENFPGNPANERDMDLHNNSVGRQIGVDHPYVSHDERINLIMQALNDGRLTWICPPTCN